MILRAAIVFLLVLNIGIAAWWISGGNAAPASVVAANPSGVPRLRLVREAKAAVVAQPAIVAPVATATAPAASSPASPAATPQCLRFGPFADAPARDAARVALSVAGVIAQARDTPARSGRGWKVHIPAFASRDDAKAMGEKIKAAGVSDWYVMNAGEAANSIALGRYGGEEAARRREAELRAKGIPAQAEAIGNAVAQAWLDGAVPASADLAALAAIAPSRPADCAGLRQATDLPLRRPR